MNYIREALQQLNEMAKSKMDIKRSITDKEEQRLQNLVLLFIFRDWDTINPWEDELFASCSRTYKWTNTNKWLDKKTLASFLISPWEDSFMQTHSSYVEDARIHEQRHSDKKIIVGEYSPNNLHDFIVEYNLWLANKLSLAGNISINILKEEIDNLLEKYPKI